MIAYKQALLQAMVWRQIGFSGMIPHDIPVIIWGAFPEYQQQTTLYRAIGDHFQVWIY